MAPRIDNSNSQHSLPCHLQILKYLGGSDDDVIADETSPSTIAEEVNDAEPPISEDVEEPPTDTADPSILEEVEELSTCSLLRKKVSCCGCVRGNEKSTKSKVLQLLAWFLWSTLVLISLWLVVVNIGATKQANDAQDLLPGVSEKLYQFIDSGPVCAFDNKGADSMIATFPDKDAAHRKGFLILHCGACGKCSDWHNLSREYLTRNFLAKESVKCAKKSLFGRARDVTKCLNKEPILFKGECAACWTTDILCTKANCTFIFLQSTMINSMGDFAVENETVTTAACEEAFCEVGQFVPCSGATRRRMNVTSTIARPGSQSCGIVDVVWADLFPEEDASRYTAF